jgi:PAS domain S-box-containing protein
MGGTGTAIREGRTVVMNDFLGAPETSLWHEAAVRCGFAASASIPIRFRGRVCGALTVYASEKGYFGNHELNLLEEAAGDVAYSLNMHDLQAQKMEAEAALKESEFFFRESQRAAAIGSYKTDFIEGRWESSEVLDSIFGITKSYDRSVQGWLDIVHPDDQSMMSQYLRDEVIAERKAFSKEYRIIRKNDFATRWVHGRGEITFDESGRALSLIGTIQDITERKEAEADLVESEERFRAMVNYSFDWELWLSPDREIIISSPSFERLTGYSLDDIENDFTSLYNIIHPEDRDFFIQHLERPDLPDGSLGCRPLDFRIITRDGRERWILHVCQEIFDRDGQSLGRRASHIDITERKLAEQAILRLNADLEDRVRQRTAQLELANKEMEAFSYSVSHDLKAPLRSIDGFSQALQEDCLDQLDETGKRYIQRIRAGAQRMGHLIDDLLKLSKTSRSELKVSNCDLSGICNQVAVDLASLDPDHVIRICVQAEMKVQADPRLMLVVMGNLLGNAWKFSSKREVPRIEVGETISPQGERTFFIRDNGTGFAMAHADKLFTPFQRLHSSTDYDGTGIGLAIVQRIIHRHGGRIWAEAEEGKGATFFFTLPH